MLVEPDRVDTSFEHWPQRCRRCDRVFRAVELIEDDAPRVLQVAELPPLAVVITEHRLHRVACECGTSTCASLPAGMTGQAFGPRLQAAVATLATRQRLSRRQIAELLDGMFGCPVSIGTIDAIISRAADAVADPYAELREQLQREPVVYADETGWALAGRQQWIWGGFTKRLAVVAIDPGRGQQAAKTLLGETPAGIVCTDRFGGYNHIPAGRRQVCWAHLARDFQAVSERRLPADQRLGRQLLRIAKTVFAAHADYREHQDPGRLAEQLEPVRARMRKLLEPVSRGRRAKTAGFARDLLQRWPSLWLFADHPDLLEPTNNTAERGLRPAVIKRKLSFGSHSERGIRATERLLTIDGTCRRQSRSLHEYLADALTATATGQPAPSLLS
jgi:transposase